MIDSDTDSDDAQPRPRAQSCFNRGLDLMNQAASEQPIEHVYKEIQTWLVAPQTVMTNQQLQAQQQQSLFKSSSSSSSFASHLASSSATPSASASSSASFLSASSIGESDDSSFLSVMLQFASLNSIEFVPALRKGSVAGKQIYMFGHVQVYVNKGVVFEKETSTTGTGTWKPIALNQLLELAKQEQNKKDATANTTGAATETSKSNSTERSKSAAPSAPTPAASDDVD